MPAMPLAAEWSYVPVGNPVHADIDVVRFYTQDTDPNVRLLGDLEIQYIIDEWANLYSSLIYCASVAADIISAKFAGVVSVSADGVSVNVADLSTKYALLATGLRAKHHQHADVGGVVDLENLLWDPFQDPSIAPLVFGVGAMDNREAGRQNYGSQRSNNVYAPDGSPGGY